MIINCSAQCLQNGSMKTSLFYAVVDKNVLYTGEVSWSIRCSSVGLKFIVSRKKPCCLRLGERWNELSSDRSGWIQRLLPFPLTTMLVSAVVLYWIYEIYKAVVLFIQVVNTECCGHNQLPVSGLSSFAHALIGLASGNIWRMSVSRTRESLTGQ